MLIFYCQPIVLEYRNCEIDLDSTMLKLVHFSQVDLPYFCQ